MIRSKRFEGARFRGRLCVAVDGTLCERKRGSGLPDREKRRYALAERLKRTFPHQSFCIVGDALYACGPVMDICRANRWEFVLTFKEGVMPRAWEAVQSAKSTGAPSFGISAPVHGRMTPWCFLIYCWQIKSTSCRAMP